MTDGTFYKLLSSVRVSRNARDSMRAHLVFIFLITCSTPSFKKKNFFETYIDEVHIYISVLKVEVIYLQRAPL